MSSDLNTGMSPSDEPTVHRTELEEEEEELGIYSDEDDDCEDLSDNEPPITEQDTSGRPQSQFKLRVLSAAPLRNVEASARGPITNCIDSNHVDSHYDFDEDDSSDQFDDLDINSESPHEQSERRRNNNRDTQITQQPPGRQYRPLQQGGMDEFVDEGFVDGEVRTDHRLIKLYRTILRSSGNRNIRDNEHIPTSDVAEISDRTPTPRSRPRTPFFEIRESPILKPNRINSSVKYIYLKQEKPRPLRPLKAWKGYHGNIYFEPMTIRNYTLDDVHKTPRQVTAYLPNPDLLPDLPKSSVSQKSAICQSLSGTQRIQARRQCITPAVLPRGSITIPRRRKLADNSEPMYPYTDFRLAKSSTEINMSRSQTAQFNYRNQSAHICKGSVVQQLIQKKGQKADKGEIVCDVFASSTKALQTKFRHKDVIKPSRSLINISLPVSAD